MSSVQSDNEESDNDNGNEHEESTSIPAQKYSLRSPVQNRLFKDDVLLEDSGRDSESDDGHNQSILSECSGALKTYFYDRLLQVVLFLGGTVNDTQGWRVQVTKKDGGLTMGILEVEYINAYNRKFKNRVEVACFLGLMPTVRNIRSMSRDQHFINAIEVREIHLISQLLAVVGFRCTEFQYSSDVITLKYLNSEGELVSATSTDIVSGEKLHFSFGNCTILNWGKIVQDVNFHSSTQIYPLGFKCLRLEHDVKLDKIVDCLCEIDSVAEPRQHSSSDSSAKKTSMMPVFRISVSWQLLDGTKAIRVYEAQTPQQAWQAVMLERVGTKDYTSSTSIHSNDENVDEFEPADAEELELRAELKEQRRLYYRALRAEQNAGNQAPVKPRLALDAVDSFGEDLILRMIEGMEGSFKCSHYQFLDSREKEAGKKNMLRAYSKIFVKAKNLDKVIGRNSAVSRKRARVDENGGIQIGAFGSAGKKMKNDNSGNKQMRTLSQAFMKNRTAKIRELEKGVTILKAAMIRNIKRRRDDAKLFVEAVCEREEQQKAAAAATSGGELGAVIAAGGIKAPLQPLSEELMSELVKVPRPESTDNSLLMDGEVFGQILEIWEYLHTFSKPLKLVSDSSSGSSSGTGGVGVPTIKSLLQVMKSADPAYRTVRQYLKGLEHTYEWITATDHGSEAEAPAGMLNDLGVALTTPMLKEFERLFGVDQVEAQIAEVRIPVNTLTWREIARVVLMQWACKDVGMADADIATMIKGRGFYTTPESADRKTLKLARRRIVCNYTIRDEFQESIYGFQSGTVVRIPSPSVPLYPHEIVWSDLIQALHQVPDSSAWLIREVIRNAAVAACAVDRSPSAKKLRKALLDCLSLGLLRASNAGAAKQAALALLQSAFYLGITGSDPPTTSVYSVGMDRLKLMCDYSPYSMPTCALDLWEKQLRSSKRWAQSDYADAVLASESAQEGLQQDDDMLLDVKVDKNDDEDSEDDEEVVAASDKKIVGDGAVMDLSQDSGKIDSRGYSELREGVSADTHISLEDAVTDAKEEEWREPDSVDAEKLSIAMQRCYLVMRDLMSYSHAKHFLYPVDVKDVPLYYKYTSQPLSLSEIRSHLVSGGYNDSLSAFYSDVNLLIENALSFNLEGSPAKAAALKLQVIFERLFFETVLSWEHPLPFHDSCHFCRSGYPVPANKGAVCDRCEASYHLHCLDLTCPPRSEWYCFPCVEQRSMANVHPYKTADVRHPSDPEAVGEVVGIEQIRQTLMFVVAFGSVREMWTPKKVREFAIDRALFDQLIAAGGSLDADAGRAARIRSKVVPPPMIITLPSGYSIEDYDNVCGQARGYSGWGSSHCLAPSVLLDAYSTLAKHGAAMDVQFDKMRKAVAALGYGGWSPDETSAAEWAVILRALLQRALAMPALSAAMAQYEEGVDDHMVHKMLESVQNNNLNLSRLTQLCRDQKRKSVKSPSGASGDITPVTGPKGALKKAAKEAASLSDEEEASDSEDSDSESDSDDSSLYSEDAEFDDPLPGQKTSTSAFVSASTTADTIACADPVESSDDENDLDFFDEQGNCLTSGSRPPKVDPRVVEEQWEVRQLSRQKGREDALLTEVLVWDILNELDVDGAAESAEEGFTLVQQDLGPFYKSAVNAIVKSCIGKPSESLLVEDWCVGWDTKMAALHRRQAHRQNLLDPPSELVCPFCGCEEGYLGSPFVRGLSRAEYEAFMQSSPAGLELSAASDALEIKDPAAVALTRARQPASRASIQALLTPGSISANTGIKGFRARNRALNGLVWMPYDEGDAQIESKECALINRPMVSGSLIVHECCADFMHFNRQLSEGRYQSTEDKRVVEVLLGVGRGRSTPLGSDRAGSLYWVFLGSPSLYVSTAGAAQSIGKSGKSVEDSPSAEMEVVKTDDSFTAHSNAASWYCYDSVSDISAVIHWLDDRIGSERLLKRILSLLFPESVSRAAPPASSTVSANASLADTNGGDDSESEDEHEMADVVAPTSTTPVPDNDISSDVGADDDEGDSESDEEAPVYDDEEAEFDDSYDVSTSIAESKPKREVKLIVAESIQQNMTATVRSTNGSSNAVLFRRGDQVLVEASAANHILWEAKVIDVKSDTLTGESYYKVHFHQWSAAYDGWYTGDVITSQSKSREGAKLQVQRSRNHFLKQQVYEAPPVLQTLLAYQFMRESKRASGPYRPPLTYSDAHSTLGALRTAMLMIEAALPQGAVDESEDRWADQFVVSWRHAVCASSDATSLMQCQIMLEYGIKTAWLKPTGLKMFSCFPSRTLSMRNATCGMVAIRIWVLDQTIKYDKVLEEEKVSNRGRPPKNPASAGSGGSNAAVAKNIEGPSGGGSGGVSKAGRPKKQKVIKDD